MKKTLTLILAIILSMSVFFTNIAGIKMIVMANDVLEDSSGDSEIEEYAVDSEPDPMAEPEIQPDPQPDPGPSEEEKARQEALEREAREAEEAAKKAAEDQAAEEAKKQAEAEEEARKKAAEEAKKQAEEEKKKEASIVLLKANVDTVDFGAAKVGTQRDYREIKITNLGNSDVTLNFDEADPDQAFSISLHGDSNQLKFGETARYNVSMSSSLAAGTYKGRVFFTDASLDPDKEKGVYVTITGTVTPKSATVTAVEVTPSKVSVALDSSYLFCADVRGDGEVSQNVRWSIVNQNSGGSFIDGDGILYVANNETSGSITVIATSEQDSSKKGYATVTPQRNSYNVNVVASPAKGGNVSGGGAVTQGGSVTLSAAPNKNYYFNGWEQDGQIVSRSTNYTISNIQKNINVKAKFALNAVTVKAEPDNPNGGTVVGGGTISVGGSTTLSAKAYNGYVFTGWKEGDNVISRDASIRLDNITTNRTITGMFDQTSHTLTLSASPVEGGTVTGGGTFALNQGTTAKAVPNPGYSFVGWQVNGQIVNRDATVVINKLESDYNCTAIFIKTGTVTYEMSSGVATTGGTITPSGRITVAQGQTVTYKMTPKSGFAILAVAVDGIQVGPVNTYTFTNVQANHTIAVAFLQTDAGKAAAAAAGKPAQEQKVQKIEKVSANTATADSTVDINDAAKGAGGDTFVEEMNLDGVNVPTDEQLGIKPEEEQSTAVSQLMGVSLEDARNMAAAGNNAPILDAAFYAGTLGASVVNNYEPASKKSVDYQNMSAEELMQTSDDEINPSMPNLDVVVQKMLTPDEVMSLVNGGTANISVSLTKQDEPDPSVKKIMKNAVGKKPLRYFDLTMMKTMNGYSENVTELSEPMEVMIQIPDEIYKKGKTYSVLSVHNGSLKVLPDLDDDDDPQTITFITDSFSPYAIAQDVASTRGILTSLVLGALIALAIAVSCFLILLVHQANMRKQRRKARAAARREREERE